MDTKSDYSALGMAHAVLSRLLTRYGLANEADGLTGETYAEMLNTLRDALAESIEREM